MRPSRGPAAQAEAQGRLPGGTTARAKKKSPMPAHTAPGILNSPQDNLPVAKVQSTPRKAVALTKHVHGRIPENIHIKMVAPLDKPTAKPKAVYDWPGLFTSYRNAMASTRDLDLRAWCNQVDLGDRYAVVRKNFVELSRQLAGDRLALCAPNAAKRLAGLIDSSEEDIALKASTAVMDRAGFSPQQVAVTINQQTVTAISIPPLLREDYSREIKSFIDATEARDDE